MFKETKKFHCQSKQGRVYFWLTLGILIFSLLALSAPIRVSPRQCSSVPSPRQCPSVFSPRQCLSVVHAWTEPTASPPSGNVNPPLWQFTDNDLSNYQTDGVWHLAPSTDATAYLQGMAVFGAKYDGTNWAFYTLDSSNENILYGASKSGSTAGNLLKLEYNCTDGSSPGCSNAVTVTYDGKVGIGTTSPGERLDVNGSLHASNKVVFDNLNSQTGSVIFSSNNQVGIIWLGGASSGQIFGFGNAGDNRIWGKNNADLSFYTNNSEKVRITRTGNVGIGTTGPREKLDVNGAIKLGTTSNENEGTIRWTGTDFEGYTGSEWVSLTLGEALWTDQGTYIYPNNYNQFVITDAGNVGIGTTSPGAKLDVNGESMFGSVDLVLASNENLIYGNVSSTSVGNLLLLQNASTDKFKIDASGNIHITGNVGIGTEPSSYRLEIDGNIDIPSTTHANQYGIIYKKGTPFIHNFNYGDNGTVTTEGHNTFIGENAGNFETGASAEHSNDASYNTAIGSNALSNINNGRANVAVGAFALEKNTDGHYNVAIGYLAQQHNSPSFVTAIGAYALTNNQANSNTAIGYNALGGCTTGGENFAMGVNTLAGLKTGSHNIAIGNVAGWGEGASTHDHSNCIFIGYSAGRRIDTGDDNIGIGNSALYYATSGDRNVAIGNEALLNLTTGYRNVAIGYQSLRALKTTVDNTAIGFQALYDNTGNSNTAIGSYALLKNTSGEYNVAVGAGTLYNNTTASYNTAIGQGTLHEVTTSGYNTAIGTRALRNNTGEHNTGIGAWALYDNTTGNNNTAIGSYALSKNTSGSDNVAIGHNAGYKNTDGVYSVLIGNDVAFNNTSAKNSVMIGYQAGYNSESDNNVFIGYKAGDNITTGSNNIIIGYNVDAPSATGSNQLNIGNTIYGDLSTGKVGIGTTTPQAKLDVNGDISLADSGNINNQYRIRSEGWKSVGRPSSAPVFSFAVFDSQLYAGSYNGHVYRYDGGTTWTWVGNPGGNSEELWVNALVVYDSHLYAGKIAGPTVGGRVYRYDGGTSWAYVGEPCSSSDVRSLVVYNNSLYAGCVDGNVNRYDGKTTWTNIGDPTSSYLRVLKVYNGELYAGCADGYVYRYDGGRAWTSIGLTHPLGINSLAVYNGDLYAGVSDGHVYRYYTGTTWDDVGLVATSADIYFITVYNGSLYAADNSGGHVYRYDGKTTWADTGVSGPMNVLITYNGALYVGCTDGYVYRYYDWLPNERLETAISVADDLSLQAPEIYTSHLLTRGMAEFGGVATTLKSSSENLIYGNVNSESASGSHLLLLQNDLKDKFSVDIDGQIYIAGNVGIGTTSPQAKLDVNGESMFGSADLVVGSGENLIYGNLDSSSVGNLLLLQNESVDKFKVDPSGNVEAAGNIKADNYLQVGANGDGAPPAGDCDDDSERGRMYIDTTNNRLYICNGEKKGWDYVVLTD